MAPGEWKRSGGAAMVVRTGDYIRAPAACKAALSASARRRAALARRERPRGECRERKRPLLAPPPRARVRCGPASATRPDHDDRPPIRYRAPPGSAHPRAVPARHRAATRAGVRAAGHRHARATGPPLPAHLARREPVRERQGSAPGGAPHGGWRGAPCWRAPHPWRARRLRRDDHGRHRHAAVLLLRPVVPRAHARAGAPRRGER